jgi:guanyl-specific ribonuclease Sa
MSILKYIKGLFLLVIFLLGSSSFVTSASVQEHQYDFQSKKKKHRAKHDKELYGYKSRQNAQNQRIQSTGDIPQKAFDILRYVKENGRAKEGYVGGRKFSNYEKLLPTEDEKGQKIVYQEWDVNPKIQGKNRGAERMVTGSDGKAYYTSDHYRTFQLIPAKQLQH